MLLLPRADREQCAAFIRDERVMVIWSESIDRIIPLCSDFEERLIKFLWRSRPLAPPSITSGNTSGYGPRDGLGDRGSSVHGSVTGHAGSETGALFSPGSPGFSTVDPFGVGGGMARSGATTPNGSATLRAKGVFGELGRDLMEEVPLNDEKAQVPRTPKKTHKESKRGSGRWTWHSSKTKKGEKSREKERESGYEMEHSNVGSFDENAGSSDLAEKGHLPGVDAWGADALPASPARARKRPVKMLSPVYNGIAAGMALVFVGNGLRTLLMEWRLDGDYTRFALLAVSPLLYCVSLFFALQIVQNVAMA